MTAPTPQPDDTGEAIDQLNLILHRYKYPNQYVNQSLDPFDRQTAEMKVVDEARTALQALIQEESAHARFTEAFHIAKLESISGQPEANNRIAEGWNGAERSSDD